MRLLCGRGTRPVSCQGLTTIDAECLTGDKRAGHGKESLGNVLCITYPPSRIPSAHLSEIP